MKYLLILLASFLVASCASYKVETQKGFDFSSIKGKNGESLKLEKTNEYPQGGQCFEPMLFVLTLGIVPTHCVDDYNVTVEEKSIGTAKVTTMSGWLPLIMVLSPKWKYGIEPKIENEIIKQSKK